MCDLEQRPELSRRGRRLANDVDRLHDLDRDTRGRLLVDLGQIWSPLAARSKGQLVAEFDHARQVVARGRAQLDARARTIRDDPGGSVVIEVVRIDEFEIAEERLRQRQPCRGSDVARDQFETLAADANGIQTQRLTQRLAGNAKQVRGQRRVREIPGVR